MQAFSIAIAIKYFHVLRLKKIALTRNTILFLLEYDLKSVA